MSRHSSISKQSDGDLQFSCVTIGGGPQIRLVGFHVTIFLLLVLLPPIIFASIKAYQAIYTPPPAIPAVERRQ